VGCNFAFGPIVQFGPYPAQIASHVDHSVTRQVFVEMPMCHPCARARPTITDGGPYALHRWREPKRISLHLHSPSLTLLLALAIATTPCLARLPRLPWPASRASCAAVHAAPATSSSSMALSSSSHTPIRASNCPCLLPPERFQRRL
jgi:hypothetical protein